jgi:pyruvate/2-oxoglutarate dehydrogenase complex dihydrolipoamide acyltransferase (E2) component
MLGVGEHVAVDDLVAVIETDKVAVEIRAKEAGGKHKPAGVKVSERVREGEFLRSLSLVRNGAG